MTHPYKDWNAIRPYVDDLRNFSLRAFTHISKHEGKKLDPKARECIFLGGMEMTSKDIFNLTVRERK